MKTADHITTSQNLQHQKARPPFAGKDGEQLFFSEVHPDIQPFFNPQPQAKDNFFFTPPPIQAKLAIGRPGDKYEQEADAVADKVVENLADAAVADRTPQAPPPVSGNGQAASVNACPAVQPEKEEAPEDKEQEGNDKEIRRKPIFESEDNSGQDDIQPKRSNEPPAIQPKEEEEMASEEDQERGTGEPDVSVAGPDEGVEVANGENTAETAAETASAAGPEVSGNTAKDETARNQEPAAETAQPGQEVAPAGGETAGLAEETAAGTSGATEKAAEKETPAEKKAGAESKPSESKMEASLSGGTASGAGEKGSSGTTSGSEEKAAGESGGSKTSGEGQTTQIAESAAGGGAMASEKKAGEEKGEEGGGQEIPMEKEGYEFPEPDEKLPGQMPPPLPLGISKGQQKNLILSKGATVEEASAELSGKLQQSKGKGKPLEEAASQQMGQQMGADFSDVKIHTDNEAASMNQELGAKAFTHGKDIYFNQGQYDTGSDEGKRLLAHELTHTVQQGAVSSVSPKLEKPDAPTPTQASPSIQRFGGLVGGLIGAAGSAARGLAVEGIKRALKALGEKAMEKIMAEVMGLKGDKDQKEGDWKSQLMTMGMEFLTGEKKKEAAIGEANAGAEEQMAVKKGKEDAEKGKADPLPAWIMALIEKVLAFASSSGGGEKGGLMGTDQKAEQEAVQSGVQEDTAGWEQINAVANELAPIAGEKEKDVKNLVSALGKLKENGWKSLPSWLELFQAGKGLIPELSGMVETGKQALNDGLNKLKGKFGENAAQLWEAGSKLANGILNGSGTFRERALQAAKDFGLQMLGDARQVGEKVLGDAQGLEGRGGKLANVLMSLIDGRAAKVFNTVSSAISEGGTLLQAVPGRIGQAARSAFEWVKNRLAQGKGRLQQIIARVKAFVVKVKNAIAQMLKRAWEFLKNAVKKAIEAGKRLLKRAWEKIKELARKAMAKARELLKKVTDKIKAFLKPALDWLKKKIVEPIKNMIRRAKERIKKWIDRIKAKFKKMYEGIKKKLSEWWRLKVGFKTKSGKAHKLSFKGKERSAKLMLASNNPGPLQNKIQNWLNGTDKNVEIKNRGALENALKEAQKMDETIAKHEAKGKEETTSIKGEIQKHLDEIKKYLEEGFDDKLADLTNVTYEMEDGRAMTVTAQPLTKEEGNTKGSPASGNPRGWKLATYLNSHRKRTDEPGKERRIVEWNRVHLLHADLHGPGNQNWNLTPSTERANSGLKAVERKAIEDINSDPPKNYTMYKVVATYGHPDVNKAHSDPNVGEWNPKDYPSRIDAYVQKEGESSPKQIPIDNLSHPEDKDIPQEVDHFKIFKNKIDNDFILNEKMPDWSKYSRILHLSTRIPDEPTRRDITRRLMKYYNEKLSES